GPRPHLTGRARHLLENARTLVAEQKRLTDDPLLAGPGSARGSDGAALDPLVTFHRSTVALTEAALRLGQAFPDSAEVQLRMCDGVETMLQAVRDRLGVAGLALAARKAETDRIDRLAKLLAALADGTMVPIGSFAEIAEEVLSDARKAAPIRFLAADPRADVARFVACCSLTVAQVVARIAPYDFEFASRPLLPVVAALMMDVGMMRVPVDILAKAGPLDPAERRAVENHPRDGAELVRRLMPEAAPLAAAIHTHHERPDGTGYPDSARGDLVSPLARLLAVCSEYAALASDRPHRPAFDPRTALTDTLMAAETGRLDRDFSEYILNLSFHPIGTVVELTDGRIAVVVATHNSKTNLRATARPVVAVLSDSAGTLLPRPDFVDLAAAERGGVVRGLSTAERRKLLAERYPDLC
ncbi:MAG: HD-GYP domain-containing protein, partial [Fimbriiglobus sp.]